ncbi:ATPase [Mycoplasmopsis californica]|uniref:AAA family ATPase n=1 Tax=Mycoplasmopsis equigenitalium TaxID=114883 RepID=A0ABY5J582_9BACT|nr:AAA family ATPase [Mycoplasmopsis equigenitalium]UUD37041.1 AAA family ATPase [Mycoplasmopsis equigenitalium]VEU69659.1 ATPase [Mycoplasmopsis californica]
MDFDFEDILEKFVKNNDSGNKKKSSVLAKYGRNLTDLALQNKLEPVINRDDEIRRMIRILSRKTKNNPVLVGEPGVGKTAIVEGLAKKIAENNVPENLKGREIYEIDLPQIIAGASFQGQFEKRLKDILKEIEDSNGDIIVFIDEIHMLVGTGKNAQGGMDAANIIKPLMARGKMHLIGATTYDEYRKYIETDPALERRMQPIQVEEPSVEDTITILRGIKERFETYHSVKITDDALVAAAKLSCRYISDRFLPDKAIDLIDEAASTIKTEMNYQPEELEKAELEKAHLEMEKEAIKKDADKKKRYDEVVARIKQVDGVVAHLKDEWQKEKLQLEKLSKLNKKLDDLKHMMNLYRTEGNFADASKIMYKDIPDTEKEIEKLKSKSKKELVKETVTEEEIAQIISKWTKIPITKLLEAEKDKVLNLESILAKRVKGQNEAVEAVAKAIVRAKANVNDPNRPFASFLFMGPTGVGKTELARTLAYALFDSEKQMIRLDMSEYMEKHSVSKILGAPPGYVGFDQGGQLTEKIRKNPYTVLLFDEIEKAHPDVLNILLQLLDNGQITDAKGRTINCRNLIVIMTSNLGSDLILNNEFDLKKHKDILLKSFKPEFINRIDEIITFNALDNTTIRNITALELEKLTARIQQNSAISVEFDWKVLDFVSKNAYDSQFGARPIKRFIQNNLESFIAYKIIDETLKPNKQYKITYENDKLVIKK